jgi:glycosyltransferase involved in cell wall biosynthesis
MPKISIIVPVYNVEPFLEKCVDSVIGQTFADFELLLVNDGSTDRSGVLCDEMGRSDPRIRCIHKENGGVAEARNQGLRVAGGEYIMFIDSDDWIAPETCELAYKTAVANDTDVVMWTYVREYPERSIPKKIDLREGLYNGAEVKEFIQRRMVGLVGNELRNTRNADALAPVWGKLFHRRLFEPSPPEFVDQKLVGPTEDALFNLELFARVNRFYYLDRPLYHYKKTRNTSITTVYKTWLFDRWQELFDRMERQIESQGLGPRFAEAMDNRIALSLIGLGLNELNPSNPKNYPGKVSYLKSILAQERYRKAYANLELAYFSIHWRMFFYFCKTGFGPGIYLFLRMMRILQTRV